VHLEYLYLNIIFMIVLEVFMFVFGVIYIL